MIKSSLFDLGKGQTSSMHKIKGNLMLILAYEQFDMINVKKFPKHDNMYNNDMNYALKSSNNDELGEYNACILEIKLIENR